MKYLIALITESTNFHFELLRDLLDEDLPPFAENGTTGLVPV